MACHLWERLVQGRHRSDAPRASMTDSAVCSNCSQIEILWCFRTVNVPRDRLSGEVLRARCRWDVGTYYFTTSR